MPKPGALDGITVIDLSRLLPGPYCSMILADHGARVIAVESKRFLADGLFFNIINRNKEHMSLNLKTEQGREIFFRLIQMADVVLEGFRPGVVDTLGVGYESVRKANPKIIYCSISGYGQNGPFRDRVGHDANYLSYAGVLDLMGEKDRPPAIPGVQIADIAGGSMNAAIGILLALFAREKTGQGQYIDISMTDGMVGFLPVALFFRQLTGQEPRRSDGLLSHRYACYNTYETADGRYLSIGAVENRFLQNMRHIFKQKTLDEWDAILADHDICWGRIQSTKEVLDDPLFRQRDMVVEIEDKDGKKSETLGVAVKLSKTPGSVRTPPVEFGESTTAILRELGYKEEQIKAFAENEVF